MVRFSAPSLLLTLGCMGPCNTTDTRGDYLAEQMAASGCSSKEPCNFLADGGPHVYSCTIGYPDSSTVTDEFGSDYRYLGSEEPERPGYIIYPDGTGEPDADVNYNDLFPPLAHPDMLALQKRGKELGCRTVHTKAFEDPAPSWDDGWGSDEELRHTYSCVISTCEAWVEKGEIHVRKKTGLPDGA